jgi:hypothetical protein
MKTNSTFELLKCQIISLLEYYTLDNDISIAPEQKVNVEPEQKVNVEKIINKKGRPKLYNNSEERILHHRDILKKEKYSTEYYRKRIKIECPHCSKLINPLNQQSHYRTKICLKSQKPNED